MSSGANRFRHCVSPALIALIISGAVARAQDQPVPTRQTQPSQEPTPPPAPPAQTSSPPSTRGNRAVPYREVMGLMNDLRRAGYLKVALVGMEMHEGK